MTDIDAGAETMGDLIAMARAQIDYHQQMINLICCVEAADDSILAWRVDQMARWQMLLTIVDTVTPLIEQEQRERIVADLRGNHTGCTSADNEYQLGYSDGYYDAMNHVEKSKA